MITANFLNPIHHHHPRHQEYNEPKVDYPGRFLSSIPNSSDATRNRVSEWRVLWVVMVLLRLLLIRRRVVFRCLRI